jgi:type I site-specific restriction endonuclease
MTPPDIGFSEADTRAKLIDPSLHNCGWLEDMIRPSPKSFRLLAPKIVRSKFEQP